MEMIKLTDKELKELQRKSLDIVKYTAELCKKHNVKFFLYGGSVIGAVREQGFVPWDDDMDIKFTPIEYEKFRKVWNKYADKKRFTFWEQGKGHNDHTLSASIRDNNTTFITDSTVNYDVNQGLAVDVGVCEACAKTKIGEIVQMVCGAGMGLFKAGRVPARKGKLVEITAKIILGVFRTDNVRYYMWRFFERIAKAPNKHYETAEYVKELGMFPKLKFKREWFDDVVWVRFEDTELPIPVGAKKYLKARYGNYMELPPEKDRHPEHRIVFLDLNTPYKKYRGKKYFVNGRKK